MTEVTTSRRNVMRALAIVPAVIAAPAVASAAIGRTTGISPAMAKAIAGYHNAVATQNEWETQVYLPTWKACEAAVAAIPHLTTQQGFETNAGFRTTHLSTDKAADVAVANIFSKIPVNQRYDDDQDRACAELLEKLEWRKAEEARIHKAHNMDALDEEQDRLEQLSYRAMSAVEDFPVATLADLNAKVQFIGETEGRIEPDALLADLRRIAGESRA